MMPTVKTVEYTQITNRIDEKTSGLAEKISQRLERFNEKQMSALSQLMDVERLMVFLDEIKNNDICLSCENDIIECLKWLCLFLFLLFVWIMAFPILVIPIIIIPFIFRNLWMLILGIDILVWQNAYDLGCSWAIILEMILTI